MSYRIQNMTYTHHVRCQNIRSDLFYKLIKKSSSYGVFIQKYSRKCGRGGENSDFEHFIDPTLTDEGHM